MSADSLQRPQLQTLTLSAVVQSAQLVRGLAHTGSASFPAMKALIMASAFAGWSRGTCETERNFRAWW